MLLYFLFKKKKADNSVLFIDASGEFKAGKNQNVLTTENIAYDIQNILKGKPLEYIDLDSLLEEEDFEEMDFDEQYIKPETKKQKIALGLRTET